MVLIELVGLYVGGLRRHFCSDFVLLPDDLGAGVELSEVVDNCVLDVDVRLGEDVCAAGAF